MPTPIVNVFRYSALVGGIGYGIIHKRTLQSEHDANKEQAKLNKTQQWIQEARLQYAKKNAVADHSDAALDPENPNFDLEKLINSL